MAETNDYNIPEHIREFIKKSGYSLPFSLMRGYINEWNAVMKAQGDFWDYQRKENGVTFKVHRRTIRPAQRVCNEWASLLLNDKTQVVCESEECTEWLEDFLAGINFMAKGQGLISSAFGLGTGAWAVWVDQDAGKLQVRRYDARMVMPLSWDDDGVSECAFIGRSVIDGKTYDQLQMHVEEGGQYTIKTYLFDNEGNRVQLEGVTEELYTGCETPTFAIVAPAIPNTRVDFSPYGQSVFADAIDVMKSVDLCYNAMMEEIDLSKMRVFMADTLFEVEKGKGGTRYIPFGKEDCSTFRMVSSMNDDLIKEYAPAIRTDKQKEAYSLALQAMGDQCGFGLQYFDISKSGGLKTATEVSSDNAALMRNIRKHENLLEGAVAQIMHAVLQCAREFMGVALPDEGVIRVDFDDSIITDTASEKAQDLAEVNVTMPAWAYAAKWYGMTEEEAREFVPSASTDLGLADFEA